MLVEADLPLGAVRETVTYHDACHLAHGQQVRHAPRALLRRIPGLRLCELGDSDLCCGSAGVYNLVEPEMAGELSRRKVDRIRETGARVVASGNPGCLMQIAREARAQGLDLDVLHPVELLGRALAATDAGEPRARGRSPPVDWSVMKIRVADHARLSPGKMAKIGLATTARAQLDLYCVGPGQAQAVHTHADQDKIYYVIEGSGRFTLGDREETARARGGDGGGVRRPHGLENEGATACWLLVVVTPPPPHLEGR